MDISEKNFEATIEQHLLSKEGGYRKPTATRPAGEWVA
jgi:hypothetical protein